MCYIGKIRAFTKVCIMYIYTHILNQIPSEKGCKGLPSIQQEIGKPYFTTSKSTRLEHTTTGSAGTWKQRT